MSTAVENLIISSIHGAFIKYPEGDGGPNLDYEWIAPDQSTHIAKAILQDLSANGYQIVKKTTGHRTMFCTQESRRPPPMMERISYRQLSSHLPSYVDEVCENP